MKDEYKKAVELAENELQEKNIEKLKEIIKRLLQKKINLEKEKDEIEEKIKVIKQDIDDFKAGRLDKVKERHEVEKNNFIPIYITILNDNNKINYPLQPWRWNYQIDDNFSLTVFTVNNTGYLTTNGTTCANFTSGTYSCGGQTVYL